jgi:hypothetical protein
VNIEREEYSVITFVNLPKIPPHERTRYPSPIGIIELTEIFPRFFGQVVKDHVLLEIAFVPVDFQLVVGIPFISSRHEQITHPETSENRTIELTIDGFENAIIKILKKFIYLWCIYNTITQIRWAILRQFIYLKCLTTIQMLRVNLLDI